MHPRLARGVALATEHSAPDLRMERDLVMLTTVIANDVKALWCIVGVDRFL